jgi:hypothetical protein
MKEFKKADSWTVGDGYGTYIDEDGWWYQREDYDDLFQAYELQVRENLALKKLLDRAHERLDELKQSTYTGTGSDYLDCVLGVGGFEQYGPINGEKK